MVKHSWLYVGNEDTYADKINVSNHIYVVHSGSPYLFEVHHDDSLSHFEVLHVDSHNLLEVVHDGSSYLSGVAL